MRPLATMTEKTRPSDTVEFRVDSSSPTKLPEQLYNLLDRMLRQEFPDVDRVEVVHTPGDTVVSLVNLETLEGAVAKDVVRRARTVYNEFITSPWY